MNRRVLNALRLVSDENVIIIKPFFESSSSSGRFRDLVDYKVIRNYSQKKGWINRVSNAYT